jgi:hypothetical protein
MRIGLVAPLAEAVPPKLYGLYGPNEESKARSDYVLATASLVQETK